MVTKMDASWLDLLNSDYHDHLGSGRHEDRLASKVWLTQFLGHWNLPARDVSSGTTAEALRGLRSLLQRLVTTVRSGKQLRREDLEALNTYLACDSVIRRVERDRDGYRMTLVPVKSTIKAVLAEIAASFTEVLVNRDPSRIKICENDDCKWVFYDRSRSRTRRWCAGADGCGNLLKVRRFRERQKKGASKSSAK